MDFCHKTCIAGFIVISIAEVAEAGHYAAALLHPKSFKNALYII